MITHTQRLTQRELIVQCLSNRLFEISPEKLTQILLQLPDELSEKLATTKVQILEEQAP